MGRPEEVTTEFRGEQSGAWTRVGLIGGGTFEFGLCVGSRALRTC